MLDAPRTDPAPVVPDFSVEGRVALVTGAARGIGGACAEALAGRGAAVTLVARTEADLAARCERIAAAGGEATYVVADVTDRAAVEGLFESGRPFDVIVNSAGTSLPQPVVDVDEATLRTMIDLNLVGTFYVSQMAVRRLLAESMPGSIINLSSQMGHVGGPERAIYCMTKAGLEGMTKSMAVELARDGIRVNTVAPTYIETEMTKEWLEDPSFMTWLEQSMPMGKAGKLGDVTGAVVYLASNAALMVTGASLLVDGGWTAR